ncbi:MAG TPA: hypothetical protein VGS97_23290 [Actinocrinis sp.]|uniref:hypothetical protein n=1 Tax=Actinocrinis sp. TaxID=1920516 RepID=UPI002DDDB4D9|nr:hypothetical protein [Actinocrinis sp.]HEV2347046.1 hypothetical protein [Actinocrinis sp.]
MSFYFLVLDTNDQFEALICEEQSIDLALISALLRTSRLAASPPVHDGLLLWIDASQGARRREPNGRACILFSHLYGTRDPLVYGPLIVTGGTPEQPEALSLVRVDAALRDLFGIERGHDDPRQDGPS